VQRRHGLQVWPLSASIGYAVIIGASQKELCGAPENMYSVTIVNWSSDNIAEYRRTSPNITEDRPGRRCIKGRVERGENQRFEIESHWKTLKIEKSL